MKGYFTTKRITLIGLLGAIAGLLMYFPKFPIPFMPPFMEFDFSSVIEILGAFILGPLGGALVVIVKIIIKLITQGTSTMFIGELSNVIISLSFVIPAAIIYHKHRTKDGAIKALIQATLFATFIATVSNLVLIFPLYAFYMGFSTEALIGMVQSVNPLVTNKFLLYLSGVVPFNLIKYGVCSAVTFIIYKRTKKIIDQLFHDSNNQAYKS